MRKDIDKVLSKNNADIVHFVCRLNDYGELIFYSVCRQRSEWPNNLMDAFISPTGFHRKGNDVGNWTRAWKITSNGTNFSK